MLEVELDPHVAVEGLLGLERGVAADEALVRAVELVEVGHPIGALEIRLDPDARMRLDDESDARQPLAAEILVVVPAQRRDQAVSLLMRRYLA